MDRKDRKEIIAQSEPMSEEKYDHAEAFCLMHYKCVSISCGKLEVLWNSRDGVTPFMIQCKECDGEMQHTAFGADRCVPDFFPEHGRRVFVDFPEHFREVFKKCQIQTQWDCPPYPMKDRWETKEDALKALMEDDELQDGSPYVLQL